MNQPNELPAIKKRVGRLEKAVVSLVIKVRKMAQGQAHFEQSFTNLQTSITDLGKRLDAAVANLVAAHDSEDDAAFEQHANALDQMVNEVSNLGTGTPGATSTGQSSPAPAPATTDTPPPPPAPASG